MEIVETNPDFQDLSRLFEIYRDIWTLFEGLQAQKSGQIEKS
jgi:hypothetical protein